MTSKSQAAPMARTLIDGDNEAVAIASPDLFQGRSELVIVHNGARYRLRITRQDKLILTK